MDTLQTEKKTKQPSKSRAYTSIWVKKETRKRITQDLAKLNKKEYGRKILIDEYIAFAVNLLTSEHSSALQEGSLSHHDRFDRDYKAYISKNGMMAKDEYLGKLLNEAGTGRE